MSKVFSLLIGTALGCILTMTYVVNDLKENNKFAVEKMSKEYDETLKKKAVDISMMSCMSLAGFIANGIKQPNFINRIAPVCSQITIKVLKDNNIELK